MSFTKNIKDKMELRDHMEQQSNKKNIEIFFKDKINLADHHRDLTIIGILITD